jgi:chemotaxis protein CheX
MIRLPDIMDTVAIAQLTASLKDNRGKPAIIDGSMVMRPSSLGLQALLSAAATWRADGVPFHVANASPALGEAAATLGITTQQLHMEPSGA